MTGIVTPLIDPSSPPESNVSKTFDTWRGALVNQPEDYGMDGWGDDTLSEVSIDFTHELLIELGFANPAEFDEPRMSDLRATIQSLVEIAQVATGHVSQNEEL